MVSHIHLHAALLVAQRHNGAHIVLRHKQVHGHDGLAHFLNAALVGHFGRVFNHCHFAITLDDLIHHAGRSGNQILVKLALKALLHNFHVQQPQKAATETKAQCLRNFWLVVQRCVVELQFFERVAQRVVLVGFCWVQARKYLRLHLFKAMQCFGGWPQVIGQLFLKRNGVTHLGGFELFDASNDVSHLTRIERIARLVGRGKYAQAARFIDGARGHHFDALVFLQAAINHAHQHDYANIAIKPAINNHGAQGCFALATGRRHFGNDHFQNFVYAHTCFGRARYGITGINANHVFNLCLGVIGVGLWQVHFVEHGQHFYAQIQRGVAVGYGLRFYALRGIYHQQCAFAGREAARNFVAEVYVPRGINQVEVIDISVFGFVLQGSSLRLDGNAALFFDIHRIKHLLAHFAVRQAAAARNQSIGQCGFAVVNMGDDGEVTNMIHQFGCFAL